MISIFFFNKFRKKSTKETASVIEPPQQLPPVEIKPPPKTKNLKRKRSGSKNNNNESNNEQTTTTTTAPTSPMNTINSAMFGPTLNSNDMPIIDEQETNQNNNNKNNVVSPTKQSKKSKNSNLKNSVTIPQQDPASQYPDSEHQKLLTEEQKQQKHHFHLQSMSESTIPMSPSQAHNLTAYQPSSQLFSQHHQQFLEEAEKQEEKEEEEQELKRKPKPLPKNNNTNNNKKNNHNNNNNNSNAQHVGLSLSFDPNFIQQQNHHFQQLDANNHQNNEEEEEREENEEEQQNHQQQQLQQQEEDGDINMNENPNEGNDQNNDNNNDNNNNGLHGSGSGSGSAQSRSSSGAFVSYAFPSDLPALASHGKSKTHIVTIFTKTHITCLYCLRIMVHPFILKSMEPFKIGQKQQQQTKKLTAAEKLIRTSELFCGDCAHFLSKRMERILVDIRFPTSLANKIGVEIKDDGELDEQQPPPPLSLIQSNANQSSHSNYNNVSLGHLLSSKFTVFDDDALQAICSDLKLKIGPLVFWDLAKTSVNNKSEGLEKLMSVRNELWFSNWKDDWKKYILKQFESLEIWDPEVCNLWYFLRSEEVVLMLSNHLLIDEKTLKEWIESLQYKKQMILYGSAGVGKTYVALKLALFCCHHIGDKSGRFGSTKLLQFHPNYGYENFIEGFVPTVTEGTQAHFKLVPGPLLKIAETAIKNPKETFVLFIDELNRGNLPKIFGELFMLLEYRDKAVDLQYSGVEFKLPPNLFLICTMNAGDRSLAKLDNALRRRFFFVPFMTDIAPGKTSKTERENFCFVDPHLFFFFFALVKGLLLRWLKKHKPEMLFVSDIVDKANSILAPYLPATVKSNLIGPSHFMTDKLGKNKHKTKKQEFLLLLLFFV